jgi:hypothetical protein
VNVSTVSAEDQNALHAMDGEDEMALSVTPLLIVLSNVMAIFVSRATFVEPLAGDVNNTLGEAGAKTVVNEKMNEVDMFTPTWLFAELWVVTIYFVLGSRVVVGSHVTVVDETSHLNDPEIEGDEEIAPSVALLFIGSEKVMTMLEIKETFFVPSEGFVPATVGLFTDVNENT